MLKKSCLIFCIILACNQLQAKIYKWVDIDGHVHYSDTSHPGAKQIKLHNLDTYNPPSPTAKPIKSMGDTHADPYTKFKIAEPTDNLTIRNPQGYVPVVINIQPALQKNDKIQILIDGISFGIAQASTSFKLEAIERGSHTLSAQIINAAGNVINSTAKINFYMMPPRVGMGRAP